MSHFAVVAPPYPSHFQALQALGATLLERGHQVTFMQQADSQRWLNDPRIGFEPLGLDSHPPGSLEQTLRLAANPAGPWRLRRLIRQLAKTSAMLSAQLPDALTAYTVDAVLCDQMEPAGALAAEALELPFISIACALPVNREEGVPLPVMPFKFARDAHALKLYQGSCQVHDWLMRPLTQALQAAALRLGLPPRGGLHDCLSPLAQISQTLAGFDFPRHALPAHFHAVGPLRSAAEQAEGAWSFDARKPLVFASLGTLQGHRFGLFARIAKACRLLDVQLLLAHCGGLETSQQARLMQLGATVVTDFAPQQWAVRRADVVVSHGGLNTVMDAIAAATPLLVLPIAFDQPGVAARVVYHRLGLALSRHSSVAAIATALTRLLDEPMPGLALLEPELATAGGVEKAADIIETALRTRQPVLAEDHHGA
ncbi:glycosyltransferase [Pseudomonas sp. BP8]|uniref:glycosyltransferase n=1 Tax=Pseudomonas sp. BP8 TaxID=2817864 RepID=UPI001AE6FF8F|nr:glycosyltransferase [Pseudomonas sp. BP8]MBP2262589.1 MGT family glycosyltransferase [Pseudomonas sp. BP8]HDS1736909.1 glycosyltransferase [Pseudomonas putida]